jgi:hypothetical protein
LKIILDEGVPRQVTQTLPGHDVTTVPAEGWASVKNGKLLSLIEAAGFGAFITCDKQMRDQQSFTGRPFAVLLLSSNYWPTIQPHLAKIAEAIDQARPGTVTLGSCGEFKKRRRPFVL